MLEIRYYVPKTDKRPTGTHWKAILDDGKEVYYIQVGQEDNPEWIELGQFYVAAFEDYRKPEFIADCIELYRRRLKVKELEKIVKESL